MKSLFLLPLLLTINFWVTAQTFDNPGTPEERAEKITQEMIPALPLDTSQIDTVYTLNLKYAQIAQKEIIDPGLSKWSMFQKGNKLNKQKEKELKGILSEDQWDKYLELKASKQKNMIKKLFD